MKKEEGITLIALVVTIIVLIILAGVSINLVLGNNGIITKAKEGKEDYTKARLKEELELKITELQMEKDSFEREELYRLSEIGAEVEDIGIPAVGEYKDYDFTINEENVVTIGNRIKGEKPNIALTKNTEELANEVVIRVVVTTSEGSITLVTKPDGTTTTETEFEYTVNKNGTYRFMAEGSNGRKAIERITIENTKVMEPVIEASDEGYLTLFADRISGKTVNITYEENENLVHYYSENHVATWNEYQGSFNTISSAIKAKSVDKVTGNTLAEVETELHYADDVLSWVVFDSDESTRHVFWYNADGVEGKIHLKIDRSCWGRNLKLLLWTGTYASLDIRFLDENMNRIDNHPVHASVKEEWRDWVQVMVPDGACYLQFACGYTDISGMVHYAGVDEIVLQ